jgi:hypothetical protein
VTASLPSVCDVALGKGWLFAEGRILGSQKRSILCRVSATWRSAKAVSLPRAGSLALGKELFFAECLRRGSRQNVRSLPRVWSATLGKEVISRFCRVPTLGKVTNITHINRFFLFHPHIYIKKHISSQRPLQVLQNFNDEIIKQ